MARIARVCALAALLLATGATAAEAFNAHGSVEQVYVTGLPAGAGMSLLDPGGRGRDEERQRARRPAVPQRQAGQRLPRPPRPRQRDVRSADGAHDAAGAAQHRRLQPDDPDRRLRLPDHPRRHQAGHRCIRRRTCERRAGRRPASRTAVPAGPGPDPDRVLGLRLRRPGRPAERDRDPRQPDGLHGRRRQHARHRLLGRRVRLLRAAAEPRRLRRDRDGRAPAVGRAQQGRDDGHLLRRHQPALHRRRPARRAWPRSRRCR